MNAIRGRVAVDRHHQPSCRRQALQDGDRIVTLEHRVAERCRESVEPARTDEEVDLVRGEPPSHSSWR